MNYDKCKLTRRSCLKKSGKLLLSAGLLLSSINVYAEEDYMGPKCAKCSLRARYDANPKSFTGRIWKWHISWCPGWKKYLNYVGEDERIQLMEKYK